MVRWEAVITSIMGAALGTALVLGAAWFPVAALPDTSMTCTIPFSTSVPPSSPTHYSAGPPRCYLHAVRRASTSFEPSPAVEDRPRSDESSDRAAGSRWPTVLVETWTARPACHRDR
jgi:hypothetical protein